MNKILLFLFSFVGLCMSTFATVQTTFTGDVLKERQDFYDKEITSCKAKNNISDAYWNLVRKSLLTADINSMNDIIINEAKVLATFTADEQKEITKNYNPEMARHSFGGILECHQTLIPEAFKFYMNKEDNCLVFYMLEAYHPQHLGLTDKEAYDVYTKYLPLYDRDDSNNVKRLINTYVDLCTKVDDNSAAKATLKKLNIKYTKKLITNKEEWEPVVALIRTTLETL